MAPSVQGINIGGYRFFFKSNEGPVPHVHVKTPSGEIKWWLGKDGAGVVTLKEDLGIKGNDRRQSKRYVEQHYDTILQAWNDFQARRGSADPDAFVWEVKSDGFWLYVNRELYWIDFESHPVFRYADDDELLAFEFDPKTEGLYWPALDADYSLRIFRHPERYPIRMTHLRERDGSSRYR